MEVSENCSSSPSKFYHGLSAIPIDCQTFRLVNMAQGGHLNQTSIGTQYDSLTTNSSLPSSSSPRLLACNVHLDPSFIPNHAHSASPSFYESFIREGYHSMPISSPSTRSSILEGVSPDTIPDSTSSSISVCEDRQFPGSFNSLSGDNICNPEPISSLLSSVPSDYPLSGNPCFSLLCQVLETDLKLKKIANAKPNISAMERDLYHKLQLLEAGNPAQISRLCVFYKQQTHNIEVDRFQTIYKEGRDRHYIELLNNHFDDQLVQIINRVNKSVGKLQNSTVSSDSCSTSDTNVSVPILSNPYDTFISPYTYTSTPSKQLVLHNQLSSSDPSIPTPPILLQPLNSNVNLSPSTRTWVYSLSETSSSSSSSPPILGSSQLILSPTPPPFLADISPIVKIRNVISKRAITMLEAWYSNHIEHPYPTSSATANLAEAADLSTGQVRKWFANKRCRSKNTKSLSVIACRKRLERLGHLF